MLIKGAEHRHSEPMQLEKCMDLMYEFMEEYKYDIK